tara:strand:- start:4813 stop:4935 length:123 start_codon:yes stop_codon:yes gene_type:complete
MQFSRAGLFAGQNFPVPAKRACRAKKKPPGIAPPAAAMCF